MCVKTIILVIIFALAFSAYEDVRGVNSTGFIGADGHNIVLQNNKSAVDPTLLQVQQFAWEDKTNHITYGPNFMCGDFAEVFHKNAEKAGYRCGWVAIRFEDDDEYHALNVFNTTDSGLVFVDSSCGDSFANVEEGQTLHEWGVVAHYSIYW